MLRLKFVVTSHIEIKDLKLALENPENTKIFVNGEHIESEVTGWFVDKSIKRSRFQVSPSEIRKLYWKYRLIQKPTWNGAIYWEILEWRSTEDTLKL